MFLIFFTSIWILIWKIEITRFLVSNSWEVEHLLSFHLFPKIFQSLQSQHYHPNCSNQLLISCLFSQIQHYIETLQHIYVWFSFLNVYIYLSSFEKKNRPYMSTYLIHILEVPVPEVCGSSNSRQVSGQGDPIIAWAITPQLCVEVPMWHTDTQAMSFYGDSLRERDRKEMESGRILKLIEEMSRIGGFYSSKVLQVFLWKRKKRKTKS